MNRLARCSECSYALKSPIKKTHQTKKLEAASPYFNKKSTVLLSVSAVVWEGGGHEMFVKWYIVVFLKSNIGSHILKQRQSEPPFSIQCFSKHASCKKKSPI